MTSHLPRLIPNARARRRLSTLGLAVAAICVGGCASIQAPIGGRSAGASASEGVARSWPEVWQRVRQAVKIGRASDQRFLAARDNNVERFAQAERDLALLQLYSPAEAEVLRGRAWSVQLSQATDPREKAQMQAEEAASYRRALELSPNGELASHDPEMLNALGYFMADKGTSRQDFERAERLVRQALKQQDKAVAKAREQGEESAEFLSARYSRSNTRDSLAWALFKQAQVDEPLARHTVALLEQARREQQAALDEARQSLAALKGAAPVLSAELPYHLAMILRAQNALAPSQKTTQEARDLLREAIALDPKFEPAHEALGR